MNETISVIGLGRLGLPMAAAIAMQGFKVIGADVDGERVAMVNEGRAPFYEPVLAEMLPAARMSGNLTATTDTTQAVRDSDVTLVMVPSPCDAAGRFSPGPAIAACLHIGAGIAAKGDSRTDGGKGHLVIMRTTLMPGTMDGAIRPALEGAANGATFSLVYSPEFLALGSAVHDFLNPAFVLVGAEDDKALDQAMAFYWAVCENQPPIAPTSFVNAELAKLGSNVGRMLKVTYGNMLAQICERLPGANVDDVARILGMDPVIAPGYLRGGMAYGGTCYPRDEQAIKALCEDLDVDPVLFGAMTWVNDHEKARLLDLVLAAALPGVTVAVLGLSFKMGTGETEGSTGAYLRQGLASRGYGVLVHDPVLEPCNVRAVVGRSAVVVVTHANPDYRRLEFHQGQTVIDCWRVLDGEAVRAAGATYIALGAGS